MILHHHSGQSIVEYSVLIAIVVGALLAMQIYMKRGFSGKLRTASDSLGPHQSLPHPPRSSHHQSQLKTLATS